MAIDQLQKIARELLTGTVSGNAAVSVAEQLSSGRWTHDYPIAHDEARELGLNVSNDMPKDIMELMSLFPETVRRASGVKYVEDEPQAEANNPHRVALTGYQPQPGARSFSYGPWKPDDVRASRQANPLSRGKARRRR